MTFAGATEGLPGTTEPWFAVTDVVGTAVPSWMTSGTAWKDHVDHSRSIPEEFELFLDNLDLVPDGSRIASSEGPGRLGVEIEAFSRQWVELTQDVELDPDLRRTADALIAMAVAVSTVDEPPEGILRQTFEWFAHKADVFAENAAASAGKKVGVALGVAITAGTARILGLL